ncbi:hypothetical protein [Clostridium saccharobutylicum]|uniref:Uncharacterized protein n=1 Tax=Clostridium saccharobutylicum DSM 13864 TaxID=1345695 RepID=U5MWU3_CLOSA|nr:hypothetical protein [Clostridium saccharobutylicum]AGX43892.1 hypothetical protein CLSA_c29250 [Clostridium saccharobutylicum DSM 13864]AQR91190.1 hypothetical protein CLOSC_29140 [Clostridium saccharobutylicum]AQS01094.1 hypothetical protein CSACC_29210 [Clostridium saccharobutylicum]AQS15077.1 hypothetical protein CLOSACC_29210 [Clostridium saccharobutylicum]MBA2905202.1 peptidyl-tRNA hydrolase [Clostridium saccharobutylicum]
MKTKKLSISFSEHYNDIYQYLKTKHNISLYICELVRAEMNNKNITNAELEAKIEELIKKVLKENDYSFDSSSQTATSQNILNSLSNDDKSLIKDLF